MELISTSRTRKFTERKNWGNENQNGSVVWFANRDGTALNGELTMNVPINQFTTCGKMKFRVWFVDCVFGNAYEMWYFSPSHSWLGLEITIPNKLRSFNCAHITCSKRWNTAVSSRTDTIALQYGYADTHLIACAGRELSGLCIAHWLLATQSYRLWKMHTHTTQQK